MHRCSMCVFSRERVRAVEHASMYRRLSRTHGDDHVLDLGSILLIVSSLAFVDTKLVTLRDPMRSKGPPSSSMVAGSYPMRYLSPQKTPVQLKSALITTSIVQHAWYAEDVCNMPRDFSLGSGSFTARRSRAHMFLKGDDHGLDT